MVTIKVPTGEKVVKLPFFWRKRPKPRFFTEHLSSDGLLEPEIFIPRNNAVDPENDAVETIVDIVINRRGPVQLDGAGGCGKTSILKMAEKRLRDSLGRRLRFTSISTLRRDPRAIIFSIARQWGVRIKNNPGMDTSDMIDFLVSRLRDDRDYVAFIDEGADISTCGRDQIADMVVVIKTLANARLPNGRRACSIVLAGLPNTFVDMGAVSETLHQRFEMNRVGVGKLELDKLEQYVKTYLKRAGVDPDKIAPGVAEEIAARSDRVPRNINALLLKLIKKLPEEGELPRIDIAFVKAALGEVELLETIDARKSLTEQQEKIILTVLKYGDEGILVPDLLEVLKHPEKGYPELFKDTSRPSLSGTCKDLAEDGWFTRTDESGTKRIFPTSKAKLAFARA